jgi:hypothetical protein
VKLRIISITLIICSALSLPLAFSIGAIVGQVDIFSTLGLIKYIWIMLLFIPIPLCTFIFDLYLKKEKIKYKSNIIMSIICLALLTLFGSFRFIFHDIITYNNENIIAIEEKTNLDLPNSLNVATEDNGDYLLTYAQITDRSEKIAFENNLLTNEYWNNSLSSTIKGTLPLNIQAEIQTFDYYITYNVTVSSFENDSFANGEYELIFIGYDIEKSRFIIINDYIILINSNI